MADVEFIDRLQKALTRELRFLPKKTLDGKVRVARTTSPPPARRGRFTVQRLGRGRCQNSRAAKIGRPGVGRAGIMSRVMTTETAGLSRLSGEEIEFFNREGYLVPARPVF